MKLVNIKTVANAHQDGIWAAAWACADNRHPLLLTGSADESVKVWKGDELELDRTNSGNSLGVVSVAVSHDGTVAASTSLDSVVRVFDVESNATMATLESRPAEAWQIQFDPKGELVAVAGGGSAGVNLWKRSTWASAGSLSVSKPDGGGDKSGAGKFVLGVAWSRDGERLACSTMDGTIAVFDVNRGKLLHTLEGHRMAVRSMVYSGVDSRLLLTASDDKHINMYDAEGKSLIGAMSGHGSWVLSVDMSSDGGSLASGSSDRSVKLWDLKMRSCIQSLNDHKDQVWSVSFAKPSKIGRLASVSDDKSVCLYEYS